MLLFQNLALNACWKTLTLTVLSHRTFLSLGVRNSASQGAESPVQSDTGSAVTILSARQ